MGLSRVWALIDVFRIGGFGGVVLRGLVWVLMVVGSGAVCWVFCVCLIG